VTVGPTRRVLLSAAAALGAGGVLGACGSGGVGSVATSPDRSGAVSPAGSAVARAEARRRSSGRTVGVQLTARPVTADLAGRHVSTWAYQPALAGPVVRVRPGDRLRVLLRNELPEATSVHWHGLALRNDMDGVPVMTQAAVAPGGRFRYDFTVPDPGTYWFHPHQGLQLDRGLYAPLVVEDPADPGVDVDEVLVLDDWLDGISGTPQDQLDTLSRSTSTGSGMDGSGSGPSSRTMMGGSGMGGSGTGRNQSTALGGDAGDVAYPLYLVNGGPPGDRPTVTAAAGGKIRLRLVNAGSDTAFRVAVGGHRLTVTHADGRPVVPVTVDTVLLGMGERYDVELVARSGVWPVYAAAEGKPGGAAAVLRTTDARSTPAPPPGTRPAELGRRLLRYGDLVPTVAQRLPARTVDRSYTVDLLGGMHRYRWTLGGDAARLDVHSGERIRIVMRNQTLMWHPMHLHGHSFALADHAGVRKDTVNVLPQQQVSIDFDADNPGQWAYHCHNTYHLSAGMMSTVSYRQ